MFVEPDNAMRAGWAENAVNVFAQETFNGQTFTDAVAIDASEMGDARCMISDLIADLLHLAHRHEMNVDYILQAGRGAFEDELAEEEADFAEAAQGETCDGCGRP